MARQPFGLPLQTQSDGTFLCTYVCMYVRMHARTLYVRPSVRMYVRLVHVVVAHPVSGSGM